MSFEIPIVIGIIILMFILFVTEVFALEVSALAILCILILFDFLSPSEAVSGLANPAVITIACLFILSHAIQKTGVLEYLVARINTIASRSFSLGLSAYLFSIAILSAFVNNTAIVAIFMPITIRMAHQYKISPSKVLIPLSYAAIMGGTLTLVGTSTNLLVNSILTASGNEPLGMFEFTKYGSILLLVGLGYMIAIGYKILPSRTVTSSLTKSYHMGGFLTEMKIGKDSPLVGKTILARAINQNYDVTVIDILREGSMITSNIRNTILLDNDILFVRGSVDNFLRMKEVEKVNLLTDEKLTQFELQQENNILVEALLTEKSDLIGLNLLGSNFRRRYGSFVLAIRREGSILREKIAKVILHAFDTLLVYGPRDKIQELADSNNFIVLEEIEATMKKSRFWWASIVTVIGVVTVAALGIMPIMIAALIGWVVLLLLKVITPNESYQSVQWNVIILIAALIPLGIVIQTSGTADWISNSLFNFSMSFEEAWQPYILLSLIYLITVILTEVSSNAATAIIMSPIALALAAKLGYDPRPFIFAVCFAASASFITPIGYQTNLMVYGPGGYKYKDYLTVGLPLAIALWLLASFLIPILWPFTVIG
ncbi:MAG: SLC13 family permease [Candidatus Marinimicrobia bacterium]|jgi:di/tricarboxylate transporter|nr:SLC13 family permease [Candidatus Neomarinimicrobiota bacterium]MBT3617560.1 SLC13 family permease [Candidatus Neomarinimicrobiota bacterium]MBT4280361.1 SLC13 family permease [Candidatus Neomarinimicrobiota bacterium]MBT4796516.1 SLC13 family permease [Candidatus Neomarinimicrobiota bacterium]MBT5339820.1 SLC13 family permease [Candidatus Neomarinimicrobiota bacterium]